MPGKTKNIVNRGENSWLIRYELPRDPKTGKRKQKSETVKGNQKVAERRLREVLSELDKQCYVEPTDMTVADYMNDWLQKYEVEHPVENTGRTAETLIKNHIIGEYGTIKLSDLRPYHLDRLYTNIILPPNKGGKGLSSRTARYVHTLLKMALDRAVNLNLLPVNPAYKVKPPPLDQEETIPLNNDEISRFLESANGTRFYYVYVVAMGTGARIGEVLNLKWHQVNFGEKTLTIINRSTKKSQVKKRAEAKSDSSKRTIPAFPEVISALKKQHAKQAQEKLLAGSAYQDQDLVFATALGTQILYSNFRKYFCDVRDNAGLPEYVHLHTLRHYVESQVMGSVNRKRSF